MINGIFYVFRNGIPWADLPREYGPPTKVYNHFNRGDYAGQWDRIIDAIAEAHNVDIVMVTPNTMIYVGNTKLMTQPLFSGSKSIVCDIQRY